MSAETAEPPTTMSGKIAETLSDVTIAALEATARIPLGQGLLRLADRFLWVIEKSVQWSLPVHEVNAEENGKAFGKIELVRPMPWIFFLPSLVILRACRLGINIGAIILGYPKLQTTGMVKFIQKGRRRLRMIKCNGLKNMRHRRISRNRDEELTEAKKSLLKSMLSTLSALSCLEASGRTPSPPPTRVYVQHSEPDTSSTPEEKSTTESTSPRQPDPKRKYSEVVELDDSSELQSEEESTDAKLERLATSAYSDADDPDFDPTEEELLAAESTSADEDDEDYMSDTEINDLRIDSIVNCIPLKPATGVGGDVILEESEPEQELLAESVPEVGAEPPAANKISTQNKMAEEETVEMLKPSEEREDNKLVQDEQHDPVTPVTPGTDGENIANFYSPINSPGDSVGDYASPVTNDASESIFGEDQPPNNTPSKIVKEPETQMDKKGLESKEKSTTSGNIPDGQTTTTNGTNDAKRSKRTAGNIHQKEK